MSKKSGFTLIEMLIVLATIATLVLIITPNSKSALEISKATSNTLIIKALETAVVQFQISNQSMPSGSNYIPDDSTKTAIKDQLTILGSVSQEGDFADLLPHFFEIDKKKVATYVNATKGMENYFLIDESAKYLAGYFVSKKSISTLDNKTSHTVFIPPNGLFVDGSSSSGNPPSVSYGLIKSLALGYEHSAAIKTDGTLWTWGEFSRLGYSSANNQFIPKQLGTDKDWKSVSLGFEHSGALKNDGTLWMWGRNDVGQIGLGATLDSFTPSKIGTATDWASISLGYNHTGAIKTDGTLWMWGEGANGKLGTNTLANKKVPTKIGTATDWKELSLGTEHTGAIKTDGTLWMWGSGASGQLGNGSSSFMVPTKIGTDTNWKILSLGDYHSGAIKTDGTLWTWGEGANGKLGLADSANKYIPFQVGTAVNWSKISLGSFHTAALKTDGTLWSWGGNTYGQLGLGTVSSSELGPRKIGTDTQWSDVFAKGYHNIGIKIDGSSWGWGDNTYGQLGLGDQMNHTSPTKNP